MRSLRVTVSTALGASVVMLASVAAAVPASAHAPLSVLNYNIHAGIGVDGAHDLERIAEVIDDSGADIVGLQEVDDHWSERSGYTDEPAELARLTGMHVYFAPIYDLDPEQGHPQRRRYGVAMLSRFPIVRAENHELTRLSTIEDDPVRKPLPGFAEIVVAAPGGLVHAYSTHLDYRPEPDLRATQVAETVDILDDDPFRARQVLVGDLNAEPGAPELAPLFGRVRDAWSEVHGDDGEPEGPTYPAEAPEKRIDYVTFSGRLHAVGARVLPGEASDHRAVLATLR